MKYRAKSKKTNEWIYAELEITENGVNLFNEEIKPETASRSLEMLDEDRKEIFEGDIVLAQKFKGVVRYNKQLARFEILDKYFGIGINLKSSLYNNVLPESHIIGNIYEK